MKLAAPDSVPSTFFPITWNTSNLTGNATIDFYYDTDASGFNGVAIVAGLTEQQTSYIWDTSGVPPGDYYLYAVINDGTSTNKSYSTGPVTVGQGLATDTAKPDTISLAVQPDDFGSVYLNFSAPADNAGSGTGKIAKYLIKYGLAPITGANWNSSADFDYSGTPEPAGASESIKVTGLNIDTTYYFAIRASDDANNVGDISNSLSAKIIMVPSLSTAGILIVAALITVLIFRNKRAQNGNTKRLSFPSS